MGREQAVDKPLQNSVSPLDADKFVIALTLTSQCTPTPDELATALRVMYPAGDGPTVNALLAAGQLGHTSEGQCLEALMRTDRADRIAGVGLSENGWGFCRSVPDAHHRRYHRAALAA